jgi:hypothetical protein
MGNHAMQRNGGGSSFGIDTLPPPSADGGRSHSKEHLHGS